MRTQLNLILQCLTERLYTSRRARNVIARQNVRVSVALSLSTSWLNQPAVRAPHRPQCPLFSAPVRPLPHTFAAPTNVPQPATTTRSGAHHFLPPPLQLTTLTPSLQLLGSPLRHLLAHDPAPRLASQPPVHLARQTLPRGRRSPHGQTIRHQINEPERDPYL